MEMGRGVSENVQRRMVRDLDSIIWERVSPPADRGVEWDVHGENAVALYRDLRTMRCHTMP